MPDIVIKDENGTPETFTGVNTIKFETPDGGYVSFRHNTGTVYDRPSTSGYRVRFIDYDGFVLQEIYVDEGESITEFPAEPVHDGLVFQGWNYTLEQLSYITSDVDVGAIYVPLVVDIEASNATSFQINTELANTLTTIFGWYWSDTGSSYPDQTGTTMVIDWGDDTSPSIFSWEKSSAWQSTTHSYTTHGIYEITITFENRVVPNNNATAALRYSGGSQLSNMIVTAKIGTGFRLGSVSGNAISVGAFYNNSNMIEFEYNGANTSRSIYAFYGCENLKKVRINNMISINDYFFYQCYKLEEVSLCNINTIGSYAFSDCFSLKSINIPSGVTSIGSYAFMNCYSLKTVSISESVTSLGTCAFQSCKVLRNLVIPNGISVIPSYMCAYCVRLQHVSIPFGVVEIGSYAFYECHSIDAFSFPATITSLGECAAYNNGVLRISLACTTPPTLGNSAIKLYNEYSSKIIVPIGYEDAYKTADGWSSYKTYIIEQPE